MKAGSLAMRATSHQPNKPASSEAAPSSDCFLISARGMERSNPDIRDHSWLRGRWK